MSCMRETCPVLDCPSQDQVYDSDSACCPICKTTSVLRHCVHDDTEHKVCLLPQSAVHSSGRQRTLTRSNRQVNGAKRVEPGVKSTPSSVKRLRVNAVTTQDDAIAASSSTLSRSKLWHIAAIKRSIFYFPARNRVDIRLRGVLLQ